MGLQWQLQKRNLIYRKLAKSWELPSLSPREFNSRLFKGAAVESTKTLIFSVFPELTQPGWSFSSGNGFPKL